MKVIDTVTRSFAIAGLLTIGGPACSKSDSEPPNETVGKTVEGTAAQKANSETEADTRVKDCPMVVRGVEVEVTDSDAGVLMTFTTNSGDVEDLRGRLQAMAQTYQAHDKHSAMEWHRADGPRRPHIEHHKSEMAGGPIPAVTAVVAFVDQGAAITLTPKNDSELEQLRQHLREHQAHLREGECWMSQPAVSKKKRRPWWTRMLGGHDHRVDRP